MKIRGVSLIETLLSFALLGVSMFLIVTLFHRGMNFAARSHHSIQASQLADSVLDEMREWALDPDNFTSDWGAWTGAPRTYPDYPGFRVTVEAQPLGVELFSPCSGLESRFADPRSMEQSIVPVAVVVEWGANQNRQLRVVAQIREPEREVDVVQVTRLDSLGLTVARNGVMEFEAQLIDSAGDQIPGVTFQWYVRPISGNATVLDRPPRDGSRGFVINRYYYNPVTDSWDNEPGDLRVEARARYHGTEFVGRSSAVTMGSI
jgi:type II secretory pathway pseudopilin PulG